MSTISDTATTPRPTQRAEWRRPPPNPSKKHDPAALPPFPMPIMLGSRKVYLRSHLNHHKACIVAKAMGKPLPEMPPSPPGDEFVMHRKVAAEYGVSGRQIDRWVEESRARGA